MAVSPGWSDNPRRALAVGLTGAAIGLGIAGYGLFTARGTVVRGVPAEDAALVNQRPILASDYAAQVQSVTGKPLTDATPAQRASVLDDMIREELMVQRGLELDEPSTDPDTRAALVNAVQTQVTVDATSSVPSEADLRRFFDAQKDRYTRMGSMAVRDLRASDAAAAADAASRLRAGQDVAAVLAADKMVDTQAVKTEEIDFAAKIHLGPALFAMAAGMDDGAVSAPVQTDDGFHVLVMAKREKPLPRAFEAARSQVYSDYKDDLAARLRDGEVKYLRGKADILIAPGYR